ncbi:MAG: hypothetical protein ACYDAD_05165 [Acidimicrobiales bacterium]
MLDSVTPSPPGVTIEVVTSVADQVLASNTTPTELTVLAETGEPFLRIGPEGVLANLESPTWYRSNEPSGAGALPAGVGTAGAAPRWAKVSSQPSWGWFDHRLHPQPLDKPPLSPDGRTVNLGQWTIPRVYGSTVLKVSGHREYRPLRGGFRARLESAAPPFPGVSLAVLAGRVPGLFLSVAGDRTVEVLGQRGEPFARVGPSGAEVNLASPTWSLTADATGRAQSGATDLVDASAPPRWQRVSESPALSWLEPRALYPRDQPPDSVTGRSNPTDLVHWGVPMISGDRTVEVAGVTTWVPAPHPPAAGRVGGSATLGRPAHRRAPLAGFGPAALAVAVLAVAAVAWFIRRPGGAPRVGP